MNYSLTFQNCLLGLLALISINSCKHINNTEDKQQQENLTIANYIKKNNITVQPESSGLYYISETEGTGDTPGNNDLVVIRYKAWNLDGYLIDSTDSTDVQSNYLMPLFKLSGPLKFSMNGFIPGWDETIKKMKVGGKAIAIIPSLLTFKDYIPRKYEIQLLEIIHDIASYERQNINNYLANNGKAIADSTKSGIYYFETKAGNGVSPTNNQTITLQYVGKLIDGRVFSKTISGTNSTFVVGAKQLVPGLEEAVQKMKVGGKATVVLPYYMAYGASAQINIDNQIVVPWYSSLVYDLQLISVQ